MGAWVMAEEKKRIPSQDERRRRRRRKRKWGDFLDYYNRLASSILRASLSLMHFGAPSSFCPALGSSPLPFLPLANLFFCLSIPIMRGREGRRPKLESWKGEKKSWGRKMCGKLELRTAGAIIQIVPILPESPPGGPGLG